MCADDQVRAIEVRNQARVVEFVTEFRRCYDGREPFRLGVIRELHVITVKDIYSSGGIFRSATEGVEVQGAGFIPVAAADVEHELVDLIDRICVFRDSDQERPFSSRLWFASVSFHRFLQIHPFLDGNGRVGRALLLLILYEFGLLQPPEQIFDYISYSRDLYFRVLKTADGGTFGPLSNFLAFPVLDWQLQRLFDRIQASPLSDYVLKRLNREERKFLDRAYRLRLTQRGYQDGYQRRAAGIHKHLDQVFTRLDRDLDRRRREVSATTGLH